MKKTLLSLGLAVAFFTCAEAQDKAEPVVNKLQDHYSQLNSKANNYREGNRTYKVIETSQMRNFWNGVLGTVKNHETELLKAGKQTAEDLQTAQATIASQSQEIDALKKDNSLKDQAVKRNEYEVENIFILGLGVNKQFFLIFSFGVIAALVVLAAVIMSLYKNSKRVTDEKIAAYNEIENEFTEYKKMARERELKIKRELQTELNSKEEMRQQLAMFQK